MGEIGDGVEQRPVQIENKGVNRIHRVHVLSFHTSYLKRAKVGHAINSKNALAFYYDIPLAAKDANGQSLSFGKFTSDTYLCLHSNPKQEEIDELSSHRHSKQALDKS